MTVAVRWNIHHYTNRGFSASQADEIWWNLSVMLLCGPSFLALPWLHSLEAHGEKCLGQWESGCEEKGGPGEGVTLFFTLYFVCEIIDHFHVFDFPNAGPAFFKLFSTTSRMSLGRCKCGMGKMDIILGRWQASHDILKKCCPRKERAF